MIEMKLPCCDGQAVIEPDDVEIRCEACGLTLELAPDAREPRAIPAAALPAAA